MEFMFPSMVKLQRDHFLTYSSNGTANASDFFLPTLVQDTNIQQSLCCLFDFSKGSYFWFCSILRMVNIECAESISLRLSLKHAFNH